MDTTFIRRAAQIAGSQASLGRSVGVAPTVVWQWLNGLRPVPPLHCPAIERATGVTCEQLRPDLCWERDDDYLVTGYRVPLPTLDSIPEAATSAEQ